MQHIFVTWVEKKAVCEAQRRLLHPLWPCHLGLQALKHSISDADFYDIYAEKMPSPRETTPPKPSEKLNNTLTDHPTKTAKSSEDTDAKLLWWHFVAVIHLWCAQSLSDQWLSWLHGQQPSRLLNSRANGLKSLTCTLGGLPKAESSFISKTESEILVSLAH
eukprot:2467967-Amphidinium_carterae.2